MSRIATGDTVVLKPTNNVYTVLTVVATLVVILGLVVVYLRAPQVFGPLF